MCGVYVSFPFGEHQDEMKGRDLRSLSTRGALKEWLGFKEPET